MATDRRNLALVALVPALLWLACWPFADMAINDDFSYAWKTKAFLETGRFTYHGWSDALIGVQAVWAAAWARVFGFSHDALRLSLLPFTIVCGPLMYGLCRRLDVASAWALFATLMLVTSPIYTPWAASFMTDVTGLVAWLAVLHATLSLTRATTSGATHRAAAALAIAGLVGGSIRQVPFMLAGVAFAIEFLRRWRGDGRWIVFGYATAMAAIMLPIALWARGQPFGVDEGWPDHRRLPAGVVSMAALVLDIALFLLPVSLALLPRLRRLEWATLGACLLACVAVAVALNGTRWAAPALAPFTGGTISPTGLTSAGADAPGERPIALPIMVRVAIATLVYWTLALAGWRSLYAMRGRRFAADWHDADPAVRAMILMCVAYYVLLFPRSTHGWTFDRYALVILPVAAIVLIRAAAIRARPGRVAWATLGLFAAFGVLVTNEHFREMRARAAVARAMQADGIQRDRLVNGLTFDAWTQLESWGYLNDFRIRQPRAAFIDDPALKARRSIYWFLWRTPAITPEYVVETTLARPSEPVVGAWSYDGIFPPGRRWIVVRKVQNPPVPWPRPIVTVDSR